MAASKSDIGVAAASGVSWRQMAMGRQKMARAAISGSSVAWHGVMA
jgi:hypothetical protein